MKKILLLFCLLIFKISFAQNSTQRIPISETYSSNGKFKLTSISYDDEFPNLKGESFVTYTGEYESLGVKKKNIESIDHLICMTIILFLPQLVMMVER